MSSATFECTSNSGSVYSYNSTYSTARSGGTLTLYDGSTYREVGQNTGYEVRHGYIEFDTSSLGSGATISSATLRVWNYYNNTTTDFTLNARLYDYGSALATGDYVAGGSLSGNTLLAHISTASLPSDDSAYLSLTDDAMAANINKTGYTRIILCSSRVESNTTPTNPETFYMYFNHASKGARLDVTYTTATVSDPMGMAGFFSV